MAEHVNVFLSSTSRDLTEYRAAVGTVIADMELFTIGMENFQPTGDNPVQVCYDKMQDAELFVGVYAYRYGYIPAEGMTYANGKTDGVTGITHLEYEWAVEKGIPLMLFVVDETFDWNGPRDNDQNQLDTFKNHIKTEHVVRFFTTPDDLAKKVATGLPKNMQNVKSSAAISRFPRTRREITSVQLISRDMDWEWLEQTEGDRLLVGQSGSGKTALLCKLAQQDDGWFVVSTNRQEIAAALSLHQPAIVIVDDAQAYSETITDLRQLRQELGQEFSIVSSCWLGEHDKIQQVMELSQSQIRHLQLLTRDEIVEVINLAGISGPVDLVREINNQAEGRPGLAVALAQLCIREGVQELASGDALTRDLLEAIERLIGEDRSQILAAFAVGGDTGLEMEVVSKVLGIGIIDLYRTISQIAAGGVIFDHPYRQTISIRPRAFRHTLIRNTFFSSVSPTIPSSIYQELAANAPSLADVALSLIGATSRGAAIPYDLLHSTIAGADSEKVWTEYAWLGQSEAIKVLTEHSDRLHAVAFAVLHNAPERALPMLMEAAIGDNRALHAHPDHPLRQIKDWVAAGIPGTKAALARRDALFNAILSWVLADKDINIALRTLEFALSPEFDTHYADPGRGMSVTIQYGYLTLPEMEALFRLWQKAVMILENKAIDDWSPIRNLTETWAYKRLNVEMSDDSYDRKRAIARQMLEDILQLIDDESGMKLWARSFAENLEWNIEISVDRELLVLYPQEDLDNWQEKSERRVEKARLLAQEWSDHPPEQVIDRIVSIEREAKNIGRTFPRLTPDLCSQISLLVDDHIAWLRRLIQFDLPSDMFAPFLYQAAHRSETGWESIAAECLAKTNSQPAVITLVLTTENVPESLFKQASEYFEIYIELIRIHSLRNELPEDTLRFLFSKSSQSVAFAAAVGEWHSDPKGEVRSSLYGLWRDVIVNHTPQRGEMAGWAMSEIFKSDVSIAVDWLEARIRKEDFIRNWHFSGHQDAVTTATAMLDTNARKNLLQQVQPTILAADLVDHLVGDDIEVYKVLLSISELSDLHLAPLVGELDEIWVEKACIALDAGYSPSEIAGAVHGIFRVTISSGKESDRWQAWINRFEVLLAHDDLRIQQVGKVGVEHSEIRRQQALKRERDDEVYGD